MTQMSEIRTLKDGETQIAPRTVAKAVSTAAGKTVEAALAELSATLESPNVFTDKTVAVSSWIADTTYSAQGYGFRAAVACQDVTASYRTDVVFSCADAVGGNFAPVAESYDGGVYIYCKTKPTATVTIPSIVCVKGA